MIIVHVFIYFTVLCVKIYTVSNHFNSMIRILEQCLKQDNLNNFLRLPHNRKYKEQGTDIRYKN